MSQPCPRCGAPTSESALAGLCPRCLMAAAMADDATTRSLDPREAGRVLESLARTLGPMPMVLLPDTQGSTVESPMVQPSSDEMPGPAERSSRVQLLGEIARGGMGAVLKGRDPDLGRDVAVKVLLDAHRDRPEMVRRFVEEAQIGGQLQHPGVVPVYELGTFGDDRPYFTMKLVKGRTLADLLGARKDPADDLPHFLGIFVQVAQTVAYAHARRVIHRDLKPSNVMVGSFGEVQVMDWGLAKVLLGGGATDDASAGLVETVIATYRSDSDRSRAGSVMGTPSYMAPEQARGEVDRLDERADVFALGSILCEILTGRPAFVGRNPDEIQRKAALGDLGDATSRLDSCGADAELVALAKGCLEYSIEDRPLNAGEVAGRLVAHSAGVRDRLHAAELARAAEAARAEEEVKRARVERQRRRATQALAAVIIAVAATGGLVGARMVLRRQEWKAQLSGLIARADSSLARAEVASGPAAEAARREAQIALARAEEDAVDRADDDVRAAFGRVRDRLRLSEQLRELLERADEIRVEFGDGVDSRRADADFGAAFRRAGLHPEDVPPGRIAAILAGRPEAERIAMEFDEWGRFRRLSGRYPAASHRPLLDAAHSLDTDPWRARLRDTLQRPRRETADGLRAMAADEAALGRQPAKSLVLLAIGLKDAKEFGPALAVLRGAWRRFPGDFWVNYELYLSLKDGPTRAEAMRYVTSAVSLRPGSAVARYELGVTLKSQGQLDEAIVSLREAARIDSLRGHVGSAIVSLADCLRAQGKVDEAIDVLRDVIRLKPGLALAHYMLAVALRAGGQPDAAIDSFREAARLDAQRGHAGNAMTALVDALMARGRLDEAADALRQFIRLKPDAATSFNLGNILRGRGRLDEAVVAYREAARLDAQRGHVGLAVTALADTLRAQGKVDEAIAEFRAAVKLKPDDTSMLADLVAVLGEARAWGEMTGLAARAIERLPDAPSLRHRLALAYLLAGDREGYGRLRVSTIARFGRSDVPFVAEAARAWALSPEPGEDPSVPLRLAELAVQREPGEAWIQYVLGLTSYRAGEFERAIRCLNESARIGLQWGSAPLNWPVLAMAHHRLGRATEARQWLEKARAARGDAWPRGVPAAKFNVWYDQEEFRIVLRQAEGLIEGRSSDPALRLPAVLRGEVPAGDAAQTAGLAYVAYQNGLYVASARLFAGAFAAEPRIAEEPVAFNRYNAACVAALAASGRAKDVPRPDEAARASIRRQALDWLRAELEAWKRLSTDPAPGNADLVARALAQSKQDADLAGVRDPEGLAGLTEAEREEWKALWADVDQLLAKANRR